MATGDAWLARLANLKVDRASGDPAPHKPLLLLVVQELAEQGLLPPQVLPLTPELAYRFSTYWSIVASRRTQRPAIRFPFYNLKSDGFWSPLTEEGKPAADRRAVRFASLPSTGVEYWHVQETSHAREKQAATLVSRGARAVVRNSPICPRGSWKLPAGKNHSFRFLRLRRATRRQ
jgi:predicted restriction endonuclease